MKIIETKRLFLRPPTVGDAEAMFALASNPNVSKYLTWEPHQTLKDTLGFIRSSIRKNRQRKLPIFFAVIVKATNELIGTKSFVEMDLRNGTAEVGTWLGQEYWGRGYSTEINQAFLRYGFREFDLKLIRFLVDTENVASWRVAEKLGFIYLGETHEQNRWLRNYQMSREMWEKEREADG